MYSAVTKILHIGQTTCSINQHASIFFFFFFSGIYLETHSRIIILAPCLLTWHTLLIISNLMLSLGGKSSICNIAQMVSCDETFHAGEKNKLKNHRRILTQKYTHILVIVYRSDWLPGMFLSPLKKHLLISVGNFCACYQSLRQLTGIFNFLFLNQILILL